MERHGIRALFDKATWSVDRQTTISVEVIEWGPSKQRAAIVSETFRDDHGGEARRHIYIPENIRDEVARSIALAPPVAPGSSGPLYRRCPACDGHRVIREYEAGPNAHTSTPCEACGRWGFVPVASSASAPDDLAATLGPIRERLRKAVDELDAAFELTNDELPMRARHLVWNARAAILAVLAGQEGTGE